MTLREGMLKSAHDEDLVQQPARISLVADIASHRPVTILVD